MGNPTAEALLISALIKIQDVQAASKYGITEHHLRGFVSEYAWLQDYYKTYGVQPSEDAFFRQYPDFPFKSHTDVRYAADEVLRDYAARRLNETMAESLTLARQGDIRGAYDVLDNYRYRPAAALPTDLLHDQSFLDTYGQPLHGIKVPWTTLQNMTGGIRKGNLWYLSARLGQGKSALLCKIAADAVLAGNKVIYYSMEMTKDELRGRVHANLAKSLGYPGLSARGIAWRTQDMEPYLKFLKDLPDQLSESGGSFHVHTPSDGPTSPSVVAARAEEYDLAVIDYVTLMRTDAGEPASAGWQTVYAISNELKQVALAGDIAILSAAQINREGAKGIDPPTVDQLAQGDGLGQDGDVVVTMRAKPNNAAAVCLLGKNRHGPHGVKWWTKFDVDGGDFDEIDEDQAEFLVQSKEESPENRRAGFRVVP